MAKRDEERFDYNNLVSGNLDPEDVFIELEFLNNLRGRIIDISLKGVGFEVSGISEEDAGILSEEKDYFLKIHAGEEFFLAGVRNRWYVVNRTVAGLIFKGGVEIQIISSEDSVQLNRLISLLRQVSNK